MGEKPVGSMRVAAVRAAHQVQARRAKALQDREAAIANVLADYFEAKVHSEKIRTHARDRAGRLIEAAHAKAEKLAVEAHAAGEHLAEQAQKEAADYDAKVGAAVRRLLEMGESRSSVADMTGLSQAVIRSIEREHSPASMPGSQGKSQPAKPARSARRRTGPVPE